MLNVAKYVPFKKVLIEKLNLTNKFTLLPSLTFHKTNEKRRKLVKHL